MNARHTKTLLFATFLALCGVSAQAQEKQRLLMKSEAKNTRYVQQHVIDVGDQPGHQVRVLEVHRTYPDNPPRINGVAIKESWGRGTSDYVDGKGRAAGYVVWNMEDGNKIYGRWEGTAFAEKLASGARQGNFHGVTFLTGGTGAFKNIRGMTRDTVRFNTDPQSGYSSGEGDGEYWFEP